jgi:hypothetical protein
MLKVMSFNLIRLVVIVLWCLTPLSSIFQLYRGVSFIGGGNRSTRRKPLTNFRAFNRHNTVCDLNFNFSSLCISYQLNLVVIVWQLDLQLAMQSVPIITKVASSTPAHCEIYNVVLTPTSATVIS